jgi:hypothetical protein
MNEPAQPHQQQPIILGYSIISGTLRDRELHLEVNVKLELS